MFEALMKDVLYTSTATLHIVGSAPPGTVWRLFGWRVEARKMSTRLSRMSNDPP